MARKSRKCWNGAMLTTTFGYLDSADRVWLSLGDEPRRVWLTRRIAAHLLVGMAHQLEVSTPGAMAGADASTRARIEHQLAFNEDSGGGLPTAPADVPIRLGEESRAVSREASYVLCTGLHATLHPDGVCTVHLALEDGEDRVLQFSRAGLHRWLRGLWMAARHACWFDPVEVPPWLRESMLPPAIQAVLRPPDPSSRDNDGVGDPLSPP
jgi:hypothetical protein